MRIIEVKALYNGAHRNQSGDFFTIPDGWAIIPDDMPIPDTFPFVDIEVEEVTHYRDIEVLQDVTKTREIITESGETVTEEYTETEYVTVQEPYTVTTVTSMTAGVVPEPEPEPEPKPQTTVWDELDAAYQEGVDSV